MSQVPQKILNWLHNVLSNGYHDVNRTYSDVARTLSSHPNFSIRTEVYTHENGRSALLLNVSGTLPVSFRGATYMFPVSLWVPHEYPRAAPIAFVTPTKNMAVRAGQYVSAEGRVYHPYLAGWREDTSSMTALLSVLQEVFAREPPVISRPENLPREALQSAPSASIPPPIPPLPPELGRSEARHSRVAPDGQSSPPPRPPKAGDGPIERQPRQADGAPPVPPHPGRGRQEGHFQMPYQQGRGARNPMFQYHQSQRLNNMRSEYGPAYEYRPQQVPPHLRPQQSDSPISPMTPLSDQSFPRHTQQSIPHSLPDQGIAPLPLPNSMMQGPAHAAPKQYPHYVQPMYAPYQQVPHPEPRKPKPPQEDLLTSPFETNLPVPASNIAPPPIPPNPQKDALLQALSQTLTQQIQSTHASNMSAIPPLRAQQAALNDTLNNINREMSQLNDLQGLLESNEKILRQAMHDADKVLDDAKRRDVPAVEEVLVAPTVVARQLYENVIEERVLEDCRTVIGKALDKGRIGGDVWAKQTRSLAREEFLKKALIKKISRGMDLVEEERWN